MSLLDVGSRNYDPVMVFPQEIVTDSDGNPRTQASETGVAAVARFQPLLQTGTSARIQESSNVGYETSENYNMRFPRGVFDDLGPQAKVEWGTAADGSPQRWSIFGFPARRNESPATAHVVYQVKRD